MSEIQNPNHQKVPPAVAILFREFGFLSFEFVSGFEIRTSEFLTLTFDIPNRRESHDRLADSRQLGRGDDFIDVFVRWPSFLGETSP
jgi:hypothetical protein